MKKFFVFLLCIGLIFYFYFSHEYNNVTHYESNKYGESKTTYEKRENYDSYNDETNDSVHYSQKSVYLISNGGKIEANCSNGYKIFIESKDNRNSSSVTRLYYTFPTKEKYKEAMLYMKKKGYRWIVNYQVEKEYYAGMDCKVEIESHVPYIIVRSIYLNEMRFVD